MGQIARRNMGWKDPASGREYRKKQIKECPGCHRLQCCSHNIPDIGFCCGQCVYRHKNGIPLDLTNLIGPRGSGHIRESGYKVISVKGNSKLEHRHVFEQYYKIKLTEKESIHHIDGNKLNNSIENLQLWPSSHPSGQRVEDLYEFALGIIKRYEHVVELQKTLFRKSQKQSLQLPLPIPATPCYNQEHAFLPTTP